MASLNRKALPSVREGPQINPTQNVRNGARRFGLPPPTKFRNVHLPPRPVPVSRPILVHIDSSGFGSNLEESIDSEESHIPIRTAHQYASPLSSQSVYGSDRVYSDFGTSREIACQQNAPVINRAGAGGNRHSIGETDYTEHEMSDSSGNSEIASHVESSIGGVDSRGRCSVEGYSSEANVQASNGIAATKDIFIPDVDVHITPPFRDSVQEINQGIEEIPALRPCTEVSFGSSSRKEPNASKSMACEVGANNITGSRLPDQHVRSTSAGVEAVASLSSLPVRAPTFHASGQGPWHAVIAYDACVRLCLNSCARGCTECSSIFLRNECALLRNAFGLQKILLQSEKEQLEKQTSELVSEGTAPKLMKTFGKLKVQVRKMKISPHTPPGCGFTSLKPPTLRMVSLRHRMSNLQSSLSSGWDALQKVSVFPRLPNTSFSRHSLSYMHASTQYIKQVSGILKTGVTTLRNSSSYEIVQEAYTCLLRLKSSTEKDAVIMQPGSGETHVFFPDSLGDGLIVEVYDSKGKFYGRVLAQVATIAEDKGGKLRWWSIYNELEHEFVGKIQLQINYTSSIDENSSLKCGTVAETVAYDLVLEVALKDRHFQQRNLLLDGPWKWLLTEFASYYGVSETYTKLRYLSYVMDVATPTVDCLVLVHDLLLPVILKSCSKDTLSHQENRILGEIKEQVEHILALVFENYKSLDESLPSGVMDSFGFATGFQDSALVPAIKLYTLLHDILSPEAQLKLCRYFQAAARKRSRRHLLETDDFIASNSEGSLTDIVTVSTAYQKMKVLCLNIRNEVYMDIKIHDQHVLPSFIDLPNITASIYSVELCNRLRAFLIACPPICPSPHVTDLVIAAANFQGDLDRWNICPIKGGVDAKELFHLYIILWIRDKRVSLLDSCKLDKVKWSGVKAQYSVISFVDEMYERLRDALNEYEIIISRWPEYAFVLENSIADVDKALVETLDKLYGDVLAPLKKTLAPSYTKKFDLKYVRKIANCNTVCPYTVPKELGILLNIMKRLLDVLRPKIEIQLKSWGSCIPVGERLSEVTVMLRAKFRNYLQAVVEKLAENTRMQNATKLKRIIHDSREAVVESEIQNRMQPLKNLLTKTVTHLHKVFETRVFVAICRGFWDRMGQDLLSFLENNRKDNRSWYKISRFTVALLDNTFASQMQQLLGNVLQEKDLEPPRSIMEVRSVLCKDAPNHKDSKYYY